MQFVSAVVVPLLMIFMMAVVGPELTVPDFRRIAAFPSLVVLTLAAQLVALPLVTRRAGVAKAAAHGGVARAGS